MWDIKDTIKLKDRDKTKDSLKQSYLLLFGTLVELQKADKLFWIAPVNPVQMFNAYDNFFAAIDLMFKRKVESDR